MAIRKKKINYTPWLIGLGAAGVIGYLFRKEIKNLITGGQNEDFIPDENIVNPVVIENIVTPGGNVAVKSEITKGLSPLGTSKGSLNMDQALKFGDKGQEVAKMQQILNRIAEITKKAKLTEDGILDKVHRRVCRKCLEILVILICLNYMWLCGLFGRRIKRKLQKVVFYLSNVFNKFGIKKCGARYLF
jgi:hypothetical protein